IVYGAGLGGNQLNATANVAGSFVYTPAAGTILNAGNHQTLSVIITPTDSANYNSASQSVFINVGKANAHFTITPYSGTYDGAAHGLAGSASGVEASPANLNGLLHLGATFTNAPGG